MKNNDSNIYAMRHSLAHIMATAIQHLWPDTKFGVGPVIENGFYYDVDSGNINLSESDFGQIEAEMKKIIKQDLPFEKSYKSISDAIAWAEKMKQPYKAELLNDLKTSGTTVFKELQDDAITEEKPSIDEVSFYTDGDFIDLCRGPHVESTGKVGAFKLQKPILKCSVFMASPLRLSKS
jgi:threonyl-tRNA synthetase